MSRCIPGSSPHHDSPVRPLDRPGRLPGRVDLRVAADEKAEAKRRPATPIVVDLTLKGGLTEEPRAGRAWTATPIRDNLKGVVERIAKAKADPNVKGLVLRIHGLSLGLAKGNELRQAIARFRESGKKVVRLPGEGRATPTTWSPPPPTRS